MSSKTKPLKIDDLIERVPELSCLRDSSERRRGTKMEQRKFWVSQRNKRIEREEERRVQRVFIERKW